MEETLSTQKALEIWRLTLVKNVQSDHPDLTTRQMAILLTVYMTPPPHTVRGLSKSLNVKKPAITRALNKLNRLQLVRKKRDQEDSRSVLIQRTVAGSVYLSEFADIIRKLSL